MSLSKNAFSVDPGSAYAKIQRGFFCAMAKFPKIHQYRSTYNFHRRPIRRNWNTFTAHILLHAPDDRILPRNNSKAAGDIRNTHAGKV